jgi:hypothetical protein
VRGTEDCFAFTPAVGGIVYALQGLESTLEGDFTVH